MNKKSLKGYKKTRHFVDRQKQRQVSDVDVINAIMQGSLTENDYGHNFIHGNLKVTIDIANSTLITVHPGDPATKAKKLLGPEEARHISELIKAHQKATEAMNKEENDFLKYVMEFSIKKMT